jgi:hypothetical protein
MAVVSTPDRSEALRVSRPKAVVLAGNNVQRHRPPDRYSVGLVRCTGP